MASRGRVRPRSPSSRLIRMTPPPCVAPVIFVPPSTMCNEELLPSAMEVLPRRRLLCIERQLERRAHACNASSVDRKECPHGPHLQRQVPLRVGLAQPAVIQASLHEAQQQFWPARPRSPHGLGPLRWTSFFPYPAHCAHVRYVAPYPVRPGSEKIWPDSYFFSVWRICLYIQ